jgi:tripartite-type tricarboxylate transporter receptor subunit TctC
MKLTRRGLLRLSAGLAAMAAPTVGAQTYPNRPIHIIVPYAPGGTTDVAARLVGQWLSDRLGQPVIIENRPGAGTNIGTEAVARAAPDGYTLLMTDPSPTIGAALYDKLNFNFGRDIVPIIGVLRSPFVMVIHPSLVPKTAVEFITFARANPGKINLGSAGTGSAQHVAGELFKMMAGVELVHVPYRGSGPLIPDLLGGQVQIAFIPPVITIEHIRSGRLRPLAVTTADRFEVLPGVPPLQEAVPGYEVTTWFGLGAPRGTPTEIVEKLNREIAAGLIDPKTKERLAALGGVVLGGSPADFGKLISNDTEKWGKVVKSAGIKPTD